MDERTVSTTAVGRARRDPELARVHLEARGDGRTPGEARDQARETLQAVTGELEAADEWTSRIVECRIGEYTFPDDEDPPYTAVAHLVVDCPPGSAGEVVVVGSDAGAEVEDVAFDLNEDTRETLSDRSLERAAAKARRKAETLARAEGVELGGIVRIDADDHERSQSLVDAALGASRGFEFQPEPVEVAVSVTVRYRLQ